MVELLSAAQTWPRAALRSARGWHATLSACFTFRCCASSLTPTPSRNWWRIRAKNWETGVRLALAFGLGLFVSGLGVALWRATGRVLPRLLSVAGIATVILALPSLSPTVALTVALLGPVLTAVLERHVGEGRDAAVATP